ncbi:hypothetical protein DA075_17565 [Methylobacterium currus]|uniref:Uncharacterized protein n=1 Tax=Methylobacterium currus TaxID=2051553 RepID=A0A2R4WLT4_9HYPH|nr:hypothetical protein DA075_17565 [Methylobacterium currus]
MLAHQLRYRASRDRLGRRPISNFRFQAKDLAKIREWSQRSFSTAVGITILERDLVLPWPDLTTPSTTTTGLRP